MAAARPPRRRQRPPENVNQLTEPLLSVKRLLEHYLTDGLYLVESNGGGGGTDAGGEDDLTRQLVRAVGDASLKISDVLATANVSTLPPRPRLPPPRHRTAPAIVTRDLLHEGLVRLGDRIDELLAVLPPPARDSRNGAVGVGGGNESTAAAAIGGGSAASGDLEGVRNVLRNVNAQIALTVENIKANDGDLDDINPLFRTLSNHLDVIRRSLSDREVLGYWTWTITTTTSDGNNNNNNTNTGTGTGTGSSIAAVERHKRELNESVTQAIEILAELFSDVQEGRDAASAADRATHYEQIPDWTKFDELFAASLRRLLAFAAPVLPAVDDLFARLHASRSARALHTLLGDTLALATTFVSLHGTDVHHYQNLQTFVTLISTTSAAAASAGVGTAAVAIPAAGRLSSTISTTSGTVTTRRPQRGGGGPQRQSDDSSTAVRFADLRSDASIAPALSDSGASSPRDTSSFVSQDELYEDPSGLYMFVK